MPLYISYFKLTQKGAENIKEAPQRVGAARQWIEAAGGRIVAAYATMGRFNYVFIIEFPDTRSALEVLVKVAMLGTVSSESAEIMPLEEFFQIVARA